MKRLAPNGHAIEALLQPETALERHLLSLPEFLEGMLWGEPRFGHPEGKVYLHVREVLDNIDRMAPALPHLREHLRIIAFAHDTFKYCEDKGSPRDWSKHHAKLARRFMEKHTSDQAILDVIELHDDAYHAWLDSRNEHKQEQGKQNLAALLERLGDNLQLYYVFMKCDTQTGDKTQASWKWLERSVSDIELVRIKD